MQLWNIERYVLFQIVHFKWLVVLSKKSVFEPLLASCSLCLDHWGKGRTCKIPASLGEWKWLYLDKGFPPGRWIYWLPLPIWQPPHSNPSHSSWVLLFQILWITRILECKAYFILMSLFFFIGLFTTSEPPSYTLFSIESKWWVV